MAINLRAEVLRRGGVFSPGLQAGLLAQMAQLRGTALTRDSGTEADEETAAPLSELVIYPALAKKRSRHAQNHRIHKAQALIHNSAQRRSSGPG